MVVCAAMLLDKLSRDSRISVCGPTIVHSVRVIRNRAPAVLPQPGFREARFDTLRAAVTSSVSMRFYGESGNA